MSTIRTNLLRLDILSRHYHYEIQLRNMELLEEEEHLEVEQYLADAEPLSIYAHPHLYSVQELHVKEFGFMLSSGVEVVAAVLFKGKDRDTKEIIDLLLCKLCKMLRVVHSPQLQSWFNPFEESVADGEHRMPGFWLQKVQVANTLGMYMVPMDLVFADSFELTEKSKVFMDYPTGNFYWRSDIVRVDRGREQVHFRSGKTVPKDGLRAVWLKSVNGYPLVLKLFSLLERLKEDCQQFLKIWEVRFDSRFLDSQYRTVSPGTISFRGNVEKSLAQIVTPMSSHNYSYQYRSLFGGVSFDDVLQCEYIIVVAECYRDFGANFCRAVDTVKQRMQLPMVVRVYFLSSLQKTEQLQETIKHEAGTPLKVYNIVHSSQSRAEREVLDRLLQFMINHETYFHLVEVEHKDPDFEMIATRTLATVYAKYKLNAWKMKNIPFGTHPLIVMSINVQPTRGNALAVAGVSTMNFYLNKFTCFIKLCQQETLSVCVEEAVRGCLEKFRAAHAKYPVRIMIFRSGYKSEEAGEEYQKVRNGILAQSGSLVTYIMLSKKHPLRTYIQIDANSANYHTVKKIQLLLAIDLLGEVYMQLEMEEPMHKLTILEVEKDDPNFTAKVLELIAKIVFAGVGNVYGKGLGLIGYAKKLNNYKDFNLQNWKNLLRDGTVLFL